jgi:hypothetical protein
MSQACSVLAPTSSGESSLSNNNGSRAATLQVEIRDKMYGVVCTLARSRRFSLDERYSLFNNGITDENTGTFTSTATAKLLFGCATNEVEALRPRATSALDALLAAYSRVVYSKMSELKSPVPESITPLTNPWASTSSPKSQPDPMQLQNKTFSSDGLSQSLLPLLWSAARRNQTKSSRLSAARWSQELLLLMDSVSAYHLLCFLAGDDDSSVSMVSKKALGIEETIGQDVSLTSLYSSNNQENKADFSELVVATIGKEIVSSRPTFDGFHVRAQAATLRFLLQLLLDENSFYGDANLTEYVSAILKTIALYKDRPLTRDEIDLLDECSICLAACTSSSQEAREVVKRHGFKDIAEQAVRSNSSKTRVSYRHSFAGYCTPNSTDISFFCTRDTLLKL